LDDEHAFLLEALGTERVRLVQRERFRGLHLVMSGPYGYVRHPAYAAFPFLMVGSGLALGSWLAALIGLLLVLGVLRRAALEDRVLHEQLEGYAAYAQQVRYRMFPGVW
jgi:protein-S-isoprenylcysteine O-methyltransferase Ste14